ETEAMAQNLEAPLDDPLLVTYAAMQESNITAPDREANEQTRQARLNSIRSASLARFRQSFGDRDQDSRARQLYELIAGIVEERGIENDSVTAKHRATP